MEVVYFTSESVTDGHPDKICDQIADAILDEALRVDKNAKMAVEATIKDDFVLVYGEANTTAKIDYAQVAKQVILDIGYTEDYEVMVKVSEQSSEINKAVTEHDSIAAGDQGIMFGYATNETDSYMPLAIDLAHKLSKQLSDLKKDIPWLKPDGKTQVTVAYEGGLPKYVHTILISASHAEGISHDEIEKVMMDRVIKPVVDTKWLTEDTKYIINPSGSFTIAGSFSDSGTTGRKLVVDSYGGMARIGGGAFSSKDPSKVDRSAAYYARHVAKSVVANGLCDRLEIQLSYAIGMEEPLSVHIDTFETEKVSKQKILDAIHRNFNFSVKSMIEELDLLRPIYRETVNFGHFGRDGFPWEDIRILK
ncbi:MAG: methionine adenosyltransferase [Erysipelothrix sp.]|nr:methionine adenosyltransferase [Erysipelothrix sp.]